MPDLVCVVGFWYKFSMSEVLQNLSYAIAFACLLFALHLFTARPVKRTPSVLLGVTCLVFAAQSVLLSLLLASGRPHWAAVVRPSLAMTIGPLLFLYFASAAKPGFRFGFVHALHFIPAVFIAYELLADHYIINIDHAIIASFGIYAAAMVAKAWRGAEQFAHLGVHKNQAYRWLVAGAVLLAALFIGEIIIYLDILRGGELSSSMPLLVVRFFDLIVVGAAVIAAMQRPSPFE
ncbi:MAG: hypothetical protein MJA83_04990, partial [Gammaproteobacteria bacterium]|nr:hypothetical protein [Gammaproteobacteria bacterium]